MPTSSDLAPLVELLASSGFVAASEEAEELISCAGGDPVLLDTLVARRLEGEPLAWITGATTFCGRSIRVAPGVYVPRWQSEPLARRAGDFMAPNGIAIDLCTGTGAVAATLAGQFPHARVIASDIDERAVVCARSNGVEAYLGDLFAPLPAGLDGQVDVIVGVVPYVPTAALGLLARDTLVFESTRSYDGGEDGTRLLRRVVVEARHYLRRGGALLLELGGAQNVVIEDELARAGYVGAETLFDDDGDLRGVVATLGTDAHG